MRESVFSRIKGGHLGKGFRENLGYRQHQRHIHHNKSISFMFFNFPVWWEVKNMWEIFRKYGNLEDIYIATSRLKNGSRFGFLRYKNTIDDARLEKMINDTWVGSFKIRGFLANGGARERKETDNRGARRWEARPQQTWGKKDTRLYSEVAGGNTNERKHGDHRGNETKDKQTEAVKLKVVNFQVNKEKEEYLGASIVGSVKDVDLLDSIGDLCEAEGMEEFETKLIGGLDVLFKCSSRKNAQKIVFDANHGLHQWVDNLRLWTREWKQTKRLCWINIQGVPIHGWSESTFRQVADEWGTPTEFANCDFDSTSDVRAGRVLVLTECMEKINTTKMLVFNGETRMVRINEHLANCKCIAM